MQSSPTQRARFGPMVSLLTTAQRIRQFNRTLGTNEWDLSPFPRDFVEAVVQWGDWLTANEKPST